MINDENWKEDEERFFELVNEDDYNLHSESEIKTKNKSSDGRLYT